MIVFHAFEQTSRKQDIYPNRSCAKSLQPCLTLCNAMDHRLPGSSVYGFSWQAYWSGLPFPPPGDLPNPGIEPASPALAGRIFLFLFIYFVLLSYQGSLYLTLYLSKSMYILHDIYQYIYLVFIFSIYGATRGRIKFFK